MPRSTPSHALAPVLAWLALSLPLLLVAAGCFALIGGEAATAQYFAQWRAQNADAAFWLKLYTDWGNAAFYLVYAGVLLAGLARGRRELTALALGYLAAQLLVSLLAVRVLKMSIGRPRPLVGGDFLPFTALGSHHSMPSGHATEFTLQTLPLALRCRSLPGPLLLGLALGLMAFTRIALGWHNPSDVLAGWALGTLGGLLAQYLAGRIAWRLNGGRRLRFGKPGEE